MLMLLIVCLAIVVICVFPVMFLANKFGAEHSGLLRCFVTILVASIISSLFSPMLPGAAENVLVLTGYSFLITGFVYKVMLGSSYIAGIFIALIPAAAYFCIDLVYEAIFV